MIPGIALGLVTPTINFPWFFSIPIIAVLYSIATMLVALIIGKIKANSLRKVICELCQPNSPGGEEMEKLIQRESIHKQFIYQFHLFPFIVGCLVVAVPVLVIGLVTFGIKCLIV